MSAQKLGDLLRKSAPSRVHLHGSSRCEPPCRKKATRVPMGISHISLVIREFDSPARFADSRYREPHSRQWEQ